MRICLLSLAFMLVLGPSISSGRGIPSSQNSQRVHQQERLAEDGWLLPKKRPMTLEVKHFDGIPCIHFKRPASCDFLQCCIALHVCSALLFASNGKDKFPLSDAPNEYVDACAGRTRRRPKPHQNAKNLSMGSLEMAPKSFAYAALQCR